MAVIFDPVSWLIEKRSLFQFDPLFVNEISKELVASG